MQTVVWSMIGVILRDGCVSVVSALSSEVCEIVEDPYHHVTT